MKRNLRNRIVTQSGFFAFLVLLLGVLPHTSFAQVSGAATKQFWQEMKEADIAAEQSARQIIPQSYKVFRLNKTDMSGLLAVLPGEQEALANGAGTEIFLPLPDGNFGHYKVWYSPIMAAELAAAYPEIRTYAGYNLDNPAEHIRFDMTPAGFHAMTYGVGKSVFIDPYAAGNS